MDLLEQIEIILGMEHFIDFEELYDSPKNEIFLLDGKNIEQISTNKIVTI
ncbi:TPA: hypothetical protein U0T37_000470 [Legionella pneumophila]|nr:hypothetical protein [Legionella pneumophila]